MRVYNQIKYLFTMINIIGVTFIIIGIAFLLGQTPLNMKIGFSSILIGLIIILLIGSERNIPSEISESMIKPNLDLIKRMIKVFNLNGNAIFLLKNNSFSKDRILIPPNKTGIIKIPAINPNDFLLTNDKNGKNLGISLPPSGLELLKKIGENKYFKNISIENIDEKLQKFVEIGLLKSVSFKHCKDKFRLEIEKPLFCPHDKTLCQQYPCPTCSALLILISHVIDMSKKTLWINKVIYTNGKIIFHLNIIERKTWGKK